MLDLTNIKTGQDCEILWMFGPNARMMREQFHLAENKLLHVVSNFGKGYVIVAMEEKRLAISYDAAKMLKVGTC